ncbi:hypothetical protein QBC36DRAFT_321847 [Triangularia setosa]|uniref:Uncharacterized protein n=1 Tax=Triangularia setosa TaxID=2587417 RepID=A0AAN6WGI3_9PEZI|nr:hypothetical protein QBC36DRAFT_321847 [Podospora setosa]
MHKIYLYGLPSFLCSLGYSLGQAHSQLHTVHTYKRQDCASSELHLNINTTTFPLPINTDTYTTCFLAELPLPLPCLFHPIHLPTDNSENGQKKDGRSGSRKDQSSKRRQGPFRQAGSNYSAARQTGRRIIFGQEGRR